MSRTLQQSSHERATICITAYAWPDVALSSSCEEPAIGAHLITQRRGYEHHGIYVGRGKVIHYAGFANSAHRGPVEEIALEQFSDGNSIGMRQHPFAKYSGEEVVLRARSRLGENRYRLLTNNCEHFCAWCLLDESRSEQVHACLTHPRTGLHALLCLVSNATSDRERFRAANQAMLSMSSVLLSGCEFAPSIPLFGAGFPDWLFCIVGGIVGTISIHLTLSRRGKSSTIAPLAISYPALSALIAMATWLTFFSR